MGEFGGGVYLESYKASHFWLVISFPFSASGLQGVEHGFSPAFNELIQIVQNAFARIFQGCWARPDPAVSSKSVAAAVSGMAMMNKSGEMLEYGFATETGFIIGGMAMAGIDYYSHRLGG